jgi:hypothetical protein
MRKLGALAPPPQPRKKESDLNLAEQGHDARFLASTRRSVKKQMTHFMLIFLVR